jgi:hypothetical protein
MSITREQLSLMPISLPWVRFFSLLAYSWIFYLIEALVLDPRMKFRHFEKNWDVDLQADIKELVQKKVGAFTMLLPFKFNNVF